MMEQIKAWWMGREPREQMLLGVFFALLVIVVYVVALLNPAYSAATAAKQEYARALDASRTLLAKTALIESAQDGRNSAAAGRAEIEQSVRDAGLALQGIVEERGGTMRLSFEEVNAGALTQWLTSAPQTLGVQVLRFDIQRSAPGRVSATIIMRPSA